MSELIPLENNYLRGEILQRLKEGESSFSVSVWIQQDLLEMTEIPTQELARSIKDYYISVVPLADRMNLSKNRNAIKRTVNRYRENTSALEEMITLYLLQKGRIELAHREELFFADLREKMRNSENFDAEFKDMMSELMVDEDSGKKKGKGGSKDSIVLNGMLANDVETARRLLVDIHKMRQDLDLQPRQVEKVEIIDDGVSPDYKVKRAKLAKKVFKTLVTADGYDVEKVEDE